MASQCRPAAFFLTALPAFAMFSASALADDIDTAAMVNDIALARVVYHDPETAQEMADAMEAGDEDRKASLQLGAAMSRRAFAPAEPVEVRLIERIRELDLDDETQTAIWRVCRAPDRTCPVQSVIFLDERAYIDTRPDHYAED